MSGIALSTLQAMVLSILTISFWTRYYYAPIWWGKWYIEKLSRMSKVMELISNRTVRIQSSCSKPSLVTSGGFSWLVQVWGPDSSQSIIFLKNFKCQEWWGWVTRKLSENIMPPFEGRPSAIEMKPLRIQKHSWRELETPKILFFSYF